MVTEGTDYSLVLPPSFLFVGSFTLHHTLGADNRWFYHYCKSHNPQSNSLRMCMCVYVHLITAHYSGDDPQTAVGCSLRLSWTAVIVLIAIRTNYRRKKAKGY